MPQDAESNEKEVSLSVEETNKLRTLLGLKPLETGPSSKNAQAEDNFQRHKDDAIKKKERMDLAEKINREKELAHRNKKLAGKGLGEASDEEDAVGDAAAWVLKTKAKSVSNKVSKREQRLANKRAQELTEMDQQAYSSVDLAGLRVGHAIDDLAETGETTLILKDSTIMENEEDGDELVSVSLAEHERTKKNLDNKKKRPGYNPYDDDSELGGKKDILHQYNDEDVKTSFTLGSKGIVDIEKLETAKIEVSEKMRLQTVSLDYEKTRQIADYYTKDELVSFKKPKSKSKSKRASSRKQLDKSDELYENLSANMDVDQPATGVFANSNITADVDNINFVDDDDLQLALAGARRRAATKINLSGESIATQVTTGAFDLQKSNDQNSSGLVMSDTSEFVQTLGNVSMLATREAERAASKALVMESVVASQIQADHKAPAESNEDPDDGKMDLDGENEDGEIDEISKTEQEPEASKQKAVIVDEPLVSSGIAATMALLNQKGLIQPLTEEARAREAKLQEHQKWLTQRKLLDRLKDSKRLSGSSRDRGYSRSAQEMEDDRDRERAERDAERARLREVERRFENYSPDVNIKYHDDHGRELSTKEAWNQLAYKFYGIMPGKLKTEKRLTKLQEELKMKQMSSIDTPLGFSSALQEKTRRTGQAHVTLSVGNHSITPLQVALPKANVNIGAKNQSKGSTKPRQGAQTGKLADTEGARSSNETVWMGGDNNLTFQANGADVSITREPTVTVEPVTTTTTTATTSREKVVFGLSMGGVKRKGGPNGLAGLNKKR
ncbi:hypothetical protein BDEG_25270 [Batrachochytrium dendrobatidis JEL423]|uniref:SART-1 protein n=1 Tax=Batrachochytrium dendrobatidis (strain JEL423) TaxID=403673 RepID=A0A177WPV8_BATDL|nr:hypothetical protein BDEG_25270 [Batrachochytrium dendrobatidis JEL423]